NKIHKIVKITLMILAINGICITKSSILPRNKIAINAPNPPADTATPELFIDQFSGVFTLSIVSASSTLYTVKRKNQYRNGNNIFQNDGIISKLFSSPSMENIVYLIFLNTFSTLTIIK